MQKFKNPLIIALDVNTMEEAELLVDTLAPYAGGFKVGMQLYNSAGPEVLHRLRAKQAPVFVDLKFHDIPNTVAGATRVLTRLGAAILNVHAAGGGDMMRAAAEAARDEAAKENIKPPLVVAVTVLTSIDQEVFKEDLGYTHTIKHRVEKWAKLAQKVGLDGVVASPREIAAIRKNCGQDFVIITPGVRPAGAAADDQKRTMTPKEAVGLGATYLVVGRPVTMAPDPVEVVRAILEDIE